MAGLHRRVLQAKMAGLHRRSITGQDGRPTQESITGQDGRPTQESITCQDGRPKEIYMNLSHFKCLSTLCGDLMTQGKTLVLILGE